MLPNEHVERMNCTLKEATLQRYSNDTHVQLRGHLGDFLTTYGSSKGEREEKPRWDHRGFL
jgi:hypothetical protein